MLSIANFPSSTKGLHSVWIYYHDLLKKPFCIGYMHRTFRFGSAANLVNIETLDISGYQTLSMAGYSGVSQNGGVCVYTSTGFHEILVETPFNGLFSSLRLFLDKSYQGDAALRAMALYLRYN